MNVARGKTPKWLEAARTANTKPADWLERALGRAGISNAGQLISAGKVRLDGSVIKLPFAPVTASSRVEVEGRPVDVRPITRVLAFHKPAGLITHGNDPEGIGTVFEGLARALPEPLRGFVWHAVGRLDRDTTGLLLFTNDEKFVAHATSPETHLPKRYVARVGGSITEAKLDQLRRGVTLNDGPARPAICQQRGKDSVELTLTEGRFHQVKRMLGAVGLPTLALHREAVGGYALDVPLSSVRELTEAEVETLLAYKPRR